MKMTFFTLLFVSSLLVIASAYDHRCPEGLPNEIRTYRDNCYQFITSEKYWPDAVDYCRGHGGRLVTISNAATSNFIKGVLNSDLRWGVNGVWIGLHDRRNEGRWEWSSEQAGHPEPVRFTNWARGHPGSFLNSARDCVRMTRGSGWKWHETACALLNWRYRSICQYKMKPTTTTSTTSLPDVDLLKKGDKSTQNQRAEEERTTEDFVWPTDNVVHILSSRNGKLTGDSRKMEYIKNKNDDSVPEVQAQKDRKHLGNNHAMMIGIVVLAVSLIICLAIIILFIVYRRRKSKYTSPRDSFSNPIYGDEGEPEVETPPPSMPTTPSHDPTVHLLKAGALPAMSCTEEGACGGGEESCSKLLEGGEGKDCCSAPPSGNPKKQGRVQNEYVDSEQLKKIKPVSCRNMPVPPIPTKNDVLCKAASDAEVQDNDINNSIDGGYLDPKKTIDYMPMEGSPKTVRANQDKHYDTPKPENIYAEIPDRASRLLEDDEELYQSVA